MYYETWTLSVLQILEFSLTLMILYNWSENVKHAPGKKSKKVRYFLATKPAERIFHVACDKHEQNVFYIYVLVNNLILL